MLWVRSLLREMSVDVPSPTQINCDNQATIFIASNPVFMSALNTLSLIAILFGISSPDPRYSTSILLTHVFQFYQWSKCVICLT
jgi:hypothetical protein